MRLFQCAKSLFLAFLISTPLLSKAQTLQPGFDGQEYLEMLRIVAQQVDTLQRGKTPQPQYHTIAYRSTETALDNRWDLWLHKDKQTMVISLRGTTINGVSWLENFYCAMIPATGSLQVSDSTTFQYKLSNDPKATVHVGWTLGLALIAPDILQKIKLNYQEHTIKQIVIIGHSQGGAIAFLLHSYLHYLIESK